MGSPGIVVYFKRIGQGDNFTERQIIERCGCCVKRHRHTSRYGTKGFGDGSDADQGFDLFIEQCKAGGDAAGCHAGYNGAVAGVGKVDVAEGSVYAAAQHVGGGLFAQIRCGDGVNNRCIVDRHNADDCISTYPGIVIGAHSAYSHYTISRGRVL